MIEAIKRYCTSFVPTEAGRYRPIVNQERDNQVRSSERFFRDLDRVFGWLSANPSDPAKVELLKELFLLDEEEQTEHGVVVRASPVAGVAEDFKNFLTAEIDRFGSVVGKRGSGKTALTNYVLTVFHEDLQTRNTTWLRADIAKVHAINEDRFRHAPDSVALTVNEYMALHAFSVILSYATKDRVFQPAFSKEAAWPDDSESPFELYLIANDPELAPKWRTIRRVERQRKEQVDRKTLLRDQDQDIKWFFLTLETVIQHDEAGRLFLHAWNYIGARYKDENGCYPRLALIFDGVDNLRTDEHAPMSMWLGGRSARSWYIDYLRELAQYLQGSPRCLPFNSCAFVIRDDTAADLTALVNGAHQNSTIPEVRRFEIACPDIARMFRRKVTFAKTNAAICADESLSVAKSERLEQFEWFYQEFCAVHLDALRRAFADRPRRFAVSDVVEITFNGNVRSFSRNVIRSFAYLQNYAASHREYTEASTKEGRLHFLRINRELIFEGSVLAGNSFMRLNFDQRAKGRWCPNIFEYEQITQSRWDGLILFRVLQSCPTSDSNQPPTVLGVIQQDLGLLGYESHCVQVGAYTALEYGLVRLGEMIRNPAQDVHELALYKTKKGLFLERHVFQNPSVLYLMTTGAKLAEVPEDTTEKAGNPFIHRIRPPRLFSASVVRTVALLHRHVMSAHNRDMLRLESSVFSGTSIEPAPDLSVLKTRYSLPATDRLLEDLEGIVAHGTMHISEKSELQRLVAQWEKIGAA